MKSVFAFLFFAALVATVYPQSIKLTIEQDKDKDARVVGETHEVTARVTRGNNNTPVDKANVTFTVTGEHPMVKTIPTDAQGEAVLGYEGSKKGRDTIRATADDPTTTNIVEQVQSKPPSLTLTWCLSKNPTLSVAPDTLEFDTDKKDSMQVTITNDGCEELKWSSSDIENNDSNWLSTTEHSPTDPVSSSELTVTVDPENLKKGTYTGDVMVKPDNGGMPQNIFVKLKVPNHAPDAENQQFFLTVGGPNSVINLNTIFNDQDGDPLSFSLGSQTDSTIAVASLAGSLMTVELAENPPVGGKATINVTATDNDKSGSAPFKVEVNYPPRVKNPIPDQTLRADPRITLIIHLAGDQPVFEDRDGDPLNLKLEEYDSSVVFVTLENDIMEISAQIDTIPEATAEIVISVDDKKGGVGSDVFSVTVVRNLPPTITHTPILTHPSGSTLTIAAQIMDDSKVDSVNLSYRKGGEEEEMYNPRQPSNYVLNAACWEIPSGDVGSRGIEYFIEAFDSAGAKSRMPEKDFFSVQTIIPQLTKASSQLQNEYHLISIPFELDNPIPSVVLEDTLGPYNDTRWRFFEYFANDSLAELPRTSPMTPGKAFWLIVKDTGKVIGAGPGKSVVTNEPFAIPLNPGWNYVGNPFAFAIPANESHLRIMGGQTLYIQSYDGKGWNEFSGSLQPFDGYTVFNDSENMQTLFVNPHKSDEQGTANPQNETLWQIRILAQSLESRDENNILAIGESASTGWDFMDRPEPPTIGNFLSVYFPHPEWQKSIAKFTTDVRPPTKDGHTWEFEIKTNIRDRVDLTFEGVADVPSELGVWLVDEAVQISRNLREHNQYSVAGRGPENPKRLKLIVGRSDFVAENLEGTLSIPTTYELSQNFPNPFNPATTLRYGLPQDDRVTLKIYNVLGKEVATLINDEEKAAGFHAVVWNGRDNGNRPVASGIYIYRIRTEKFSKMRKMVLVK